MSQYRCDKSELYVALLILFIAALAVVVANAVLAIKNPTDRPVSADMSPAQSWNAEEQCQFYNKWCYTWPNCGPCVDGKPVHADGWLDQQQPANGVGF